MNKIFVFLCASSCLRGSKITNVQCDLISYLLLMFEFPKFMKDSAVIKNAIKNYLFLFFLP